MTIDVRCSSCNKLLARAVEIGVLEIKCPRCKTLNLRSKSPLKECPRASINKDSLNASKKAVKAR
jgi:phage FluMu protein Com